MKIASAPPRAPVRRRTASVAALVPASARPAVAATRVRSRARQGQDQEAGFEGGQIPCSAACPRSASASKLAGDTAEVLLYKLDSLPAGDVDFAALRAAWLVPKHREARKDRGQGAVTKAFVLKGIAATAGAKAAIDRRRRQAGGVSRHVANRGCVVGPDGCGKFTELRSRLLFVLGALIVYRIGCFIPVPGVNPRRCCN